MEGEKASAAVAVDAPATSATPKASSSEVGEEVIELKTQLVRDSEEREKTGLQDASSSVYRPPEDQARQHTVGESYLTLEEQQQVFLQQHLLYQQHQMLLHQQYLQQQRQMEEEARQQALQQQHIRDLEEKLREQERQYTKSSCSDVKESKVQDENRDATKAESKRETKKIVEVEDLTGDSDSETKKDEPKGNDGLEGKKKLQKEKATTGSNGDEKSELERLAKTVHKGKFHGIAFLHGAWRGVLVNGDDFLSIYGEFPSPELAVFAHETFKLIPVEVNLPEKITLLDFIVENAHIVAFVVSQIAEEGNVPHISQQVKTTLVYNLEKSLLEFTAQFNTLNQMANPLDYNMYMGYMHGLQDFYSGANFHNPFSALPPTFGAPFNMDIPLAAQNHQPGMMYQRQDAVDSSLSHQDPPSLLKKRHHSSEGAEKLAAESAGEKNKRTKTNDKVETKPVLTFHDPDLLPSDDLPKEYLSWRQLHSSTMSI